MYYTKEQVDAAMATRDALIEQEINELKSIFMAGEICAWNDQNDAKYNELHKFVNWIEKGFFLSKGGYKYKGGFRDKQSPITLSGLKDLYINNCKK